MWHLWKFLASVRLAIFLLAALALISVIGTIIPQHQSPAFYAGRYSPSVAAFFQALDIPSMYGSWWFVAMLALLALNLIVCSLDRLPRVWQIIGADPAAMPVERIKKMPERASWPVSKASLPAVKTLLAARGFTAVNDRLFVKAQGAWSRLGAYIVHLSILIIFAGALLGQRYGFKGNLTLPEGEASDAIFLSQNSARQPLGFTLRCDSFTIAYYDNGMPKEYLSRLTILEDGKPVLSGGIAVNHPLRYKGITFYQASYQPYEDFIVEFTKNGSPQGERHAFTVPFQKQEEWPGEGVSFGVLSAEGQGQRLERLKLWLKKGEDEPRVLSLAVGEEADFGLYKVRVRQLYATGLQVAKDPGVPLVYLGCGLLIFGLYVAFFLAHRRVFALLEETEVDNNYGLLLAGTANKNRFGFAKNFAALKDEIEKKLAV
ncbi:MAG: cytochrome c biogenesis protein ResB [Desulfobulbaceae bacterium]|jgi:cytochrome c biogenesis protein|nr:cytochrome c biogenesis protein ResB [Desulfobulbaceae bacterium]